MNVACTDNPVDSEIANGSEPEEKDETLPDTEIHAELALDETGFGKFNYKIAIVVALVAMNVSFCVMIMGFILTPAGCDYDITTVEKEYLNTAFMFGMAIGSSTWGVIADAKGRRAVLLICLFMQGSADVVSSIVSNYWAFLVLRFASGVPQSGQLVIMCTYLGEFQPTWYRQKILSYVAIPTALGLAIAPLVAWIIIPLEIDVQSSIISFKSWNLFVAISGLPSLIIGCILLRLPETPKYLAASGRYTDLRNVLTAMFSENTGNAPENYNFAKLKAAGVPFFADQTDISVIETNGNNGSGVKTILTDSFNSWFKVMVARKIILFKAPYIVTTLTVCLHNCLILSCFYSLTLWMPEIFQSFLNFEEQHPGELTSVCIGSSSIGHTLDNDEANTVSTQVKTDCDSTVDTEVFIYTSLVGASCIPLAIVYPFVVARLRFRYTLVFSSIACAGVIIGQLFVVSSTQNLILSCISEALLSVCSTTIFCIVVEIFPTNLRATASAACSLFGRVGALIGNVMISELIDNHCTLVVSIIACEILVVGVSAFYLPKGHQRQSKTQPKAKTDIGDFGVYTVTDKY